MLGSAKLGPCLRRGDVHVLGSRLRRGDVHVSGSCLRGGDVHGVAAG